MKPRKKEGRKRKSKERTIIKVPKVIWQLKGRSWDSKFCLNPEHERA